MPSTTASPQTTCQPDRQLRARPRPAASLDGPRAQDFHDRIVDPPDRGGRRRGDRVGAAMAGMRPFVDLGTGSFAYLAWSQIVNEAAISCYMSNGRIPVASRSTSCTACAAQAPRSTATAHNRCCATRPGLRSSPGDRGGRLWPRARRLPSRTRPSSSATPSCSASCRRACADREGADPGSWRAAAWTCSRCIAPLLRRPFGPERRGAVVPDLQYLPLRRASRDRQAGTTRRPKKLPSGEETPYPALAHAPA